MTQEQIATTQKHLCWIEVWLDDISYSNHPEWVVSLEGGPNSITLDCYDDQASAMRKASRYAREEGLSVRLEEPK
jgi:hypothetical protein